MYVTVGRGIPVSSPAPPFQEPIGQTTTAANFVVALADALACFALHSRQERT